METLDISKIEYITIDKITDVQKASIEAFCCDEKDIEAYLKKDALDHQESNVTRTYLAFSENELIGYFSLAADRVSVVKSSNILRKIKIRNQRINKQSVPGIQIHHFGINEKYQKMGLGRMMMDAVFFIVENTIYPHIGVCLITAYSLHSSIGFYKRIGFEKIGGQIRDSANTCMAVYIQELVEQTQQMEFQ